MHGSSVLPEQCNKMYLYCFYLRDFVSIEHCNKELHIRVQPRTPHQVIQSQKSFSIQTSKTDRHKDTLRWEAITLQKKKKKHALEGTILYGYQEVSCWMWEKNQNISTNICIMDSLSNLSAKVSQIKVPFYFNRMWNSICGSFLRLSLDEK